jgi:hypothetical protein
MTVRVLVAFFSGLIAVITTVLIPVAHFGDKNETWTRRLIAIAFVSARHRQTKGPVSARLHLNRRATPRLHSADV